MAGCTSGSGGGNAGGADGNATQNDDSSIEPGSVWLQGVGIAVEVDARTALRVYLRDETGALQPLTAPLDEVDPTARLVIDGEDVDDFLRTGAAGPGAPGPASAMRSEMATGELGPGQRLTVEAYSASRAIRRTLNLETADAHPGVILARTHYLSEEEDLEVDAIVEHDFELQPIDPPEDGPAFWSFQGGPEAWGEDYVFPLVDGEYHANEQSVYGGVPLCDVWSRGGGLGIGSGSPVPRRLAIPVDASDGNAWISFEWPATTLPEDEDVEVGAVLLIAHQGDLFAGTAAYSAAMGKLGVAVPTSFAPDAYLQTWETYGYVEEWTVDNIMSRLGDLVELGVGVVTVDSGWYEDFITGDYVPDPALFPRR